MIVMSGLSCLVVGSGEVLHGLVENCTVILVFGLSVYD
jgi:hypothetical protein